MLIPFSTASFSKPWNRPYHIFMEWLYFLLAGGNCRISTWEALQAKSHDAWCPSGHWCSCKRRCRRNGKAWLAFEHSFCYRVVKCHQFVGTLFSSVNLFKLWFVGQIKWIVSIWNATTLDWNGLMETKIKPLGASVALK